MTTRAEPFTEPKDTAEELNRQLQAAIQKLPSVVARPQPITERIPEAQPGEMRAPTPGPAEDLSLIDTLKVVGAAFTRLQSAIFRTPAGEPPRLQPSPASVAQAQALIAAQQATADTMKEVHRIQWRQHVLAGVAQGVPAGTVVSVADVLAQFKNADLTEDDIRFATRVLNQAKLTVPTVPELTPADRQRVIRAVTSGRGISTYGLMVSADRSLLRTAQELSQPQLPLGMDEAEFTQALVAAGFERTAPQEQAIDQAKTLQESWAGVEARFDVLRSDLATLELDKLAQMIQSAKFRAMLESPALALALPVNYWAHKIGNPVAGIVSHAISAPAELGVSGAMSGAVLTPLRALFGQSETEYREFEQLMAAAGAEHGLSIQGRISNLDTVWKAAGYAMENSHTNAFKKFMAQVAFDPLSYVGFGIYAKVLHPLPFIGPPLAGIETSFIRFTDNAFLGLKSGAQALGGKTLSIMVTESTRESMRVLRSTAETFFSAGGRLIPFRQLSPAQLRAFGGAAARLARENPTDVSDLARAGRILIDRPPLTQAEASSMASRVGGSVEGLSAESLAHIDVLLGHTRGLGGKALSKEEAATLLLRQLDAPDTEATHALMVQALTELDDSVMRNVDLMLSAPRTRAVWQNITNHVENTVRAQQLAYRQARAGFHDMGALTSSLLLGLDAVGKWRVVNWLNAVSHGAARMYLMFAFYAPMNMIETSMKTALARLNPLYHGHPLREWNALSAGLRRTVEIFDTSAQGVTLQMGPVGEAARLTPGRLPLLSQNTYRQILKRSGDSWIRRAANLADEVFIRIGGRVGLELQANFMKRAMYRDLAARHPQVMQAIREVSHNSALVDELVQSGFDPKVAKGLADSAELEASISLDNLDTLAEQYTRTVIDANRLTEILARHDRMTPVLQDFFLQEAEGGRILPNLTRFIEQMHTLAREEALHHPLIVKEQMNRLLTELAAHPPTTLDELRAHLRKIQELSEAVTNAVDINLVQAQQYGATIPNAQMKNAMFEDVWGRVLLPFMENAEQGIARYAQVLRAASGLAGPKAAEFEQLIAENLRHYELMRATRAAQHDIERSLLAERPLRAAGRAAQDAWWQRFYSERSQLWERARTQLIDSEARLLSLGEELDTLALPRPFRAAGELTPLDIGKLYTAMPTDVQSGLYMAELGALRSRDEWVARVYARAQRVARQGNATADELGFSKDRIASVYDRFMEQLKGSTPVEKLAKPTLDQLDALRIELEAYAMKRNQLFPPDGEAAVSVYGAKVRAALQAHPDTQILRRDVLWDEEGALLEARLSREQQAVLEQDIAAKSDPAHWFPGRATTAAEKAKWSAAEEAKWRRVYGKPKAEFDPELKGWPVGAEKRWEQRLAALADAVGGKSRTKLLHEELQLARDRLPSAEALEQLRQLADKAAEYAQAILDTGELSVWPGASEAEDVAVELSEQLSRRAPTEPGAIERWFAELEDLADSLIGWLGESSEVSGLRGAVESWFLASDNDSLQLLGRLALSSEAYTAEIRKLLRQRYPTGFIRVYRGGGDAKRTGLNPTEREFTNVTADRKIAEAFEPANDAWDNAQMPIHLDIDSVVIRVEDVVSIASARESELIIPSSILKERMGQPLSVPKPWNDERQVSLDAAERAYRLEFPDYDNMTAVNTAMRSLFPFWTYETHRPQWIARTFASKPGVWAGWDKYMDATDSGYIHIPGTSMELNMLRGSIFMGGLRQLAVRDFPEYYDQFPGLANAVDWGARWGFYPNIFVQGLFTVAGSKVSRSQVGELVPPLVQWPLEWLVAGAPESQAAQTVQRLILPNRFRDYMVALAVSRQGFNGPELLHKQLTNDPLTEDEKQQWASGQQEIAGFNLWNVQVALLRFRPEEMLEFQRASRQLIAESTGIPVATQEDMQRAGLRISDFIVLPWELRQAVNELEGATRWRGATTALQESELGSAASLMQRYFTEVEGIRDGVQMAKSDLDRRLLLPETHPDHYTMDTWLQLKRDLSTKVLRDSDALRASPRYQYEFDGKVWQIPLTLQDRMVWSAARGLDPLVFHPEDELVQLYFDKEVEVVDGELDWRGFFRWRQDIEQVLPEPLRTRFLARIRRWDTRLDTLRRADYDFAEQYFSAREFVLSTRSADEQAIIERFRTTSDPDVRAQLREQTNAQGVKVIANFDSELSKFRQNMRRMNPELDARMLVWGIAGVQSAATESAARRWQELRREYGFSR